ncbi:hypothetical protein EGI22_01170 [Lacihabitans sp. LS3-19]|uniref:DUF6624 domain-containing protein n=1 Tax=Lacihabitans sp. LS3-19 TaxID=2487335 RepID=UPI0020CFE43F|nr:DUF6624 domain-containing protein [Lacihabitans sp. LS3-19]MCP9766498.1 hypothetical protein [Lacihabitans sp. LS3-19]
MKFLTLFFTLLTFSTFSQKTLNGNLISRLDSLKKVDQFWRNESTKLQNGDPVTTNLNKDQISEKMIQVDSSNYHELKKILEQFGFPGFDLVGKEGSGSFWLLMQHQDEHPDFQILVLDLMEKEVLNQNASKANFAYLTDRVKVNTSQEQIYGTQMELNEDETSYQPKKCIDPKNLNQRRLELGLPPIEEYIQMMNSRFRGNLKKK